MPYLNTSSSILLFHCFAPICRFEVSVSNSMTIETLQQKQHSCHFVAEILVSKAHIFTFPDFKWRVACSIQYFVDGVLLP